MVGYDIADNPLNQIEWAFGATEIIHIVSMTLSIGMIAIVDMSLLGIGLNDQSPAKLLRGTDLLTMFGLSARGWHFSPPIRCAITTARHFA